jgi:adenylosuccinate lyase
MLRKYGIPDAYDQLKALTRGKNISKEDILKFAESLEILSEEDRETLVHMTPASYIGYASELAELKIK